MVPNKAKKPTPQERWGQLLNGRLTDKQIIDLFDEFGMANRLKTTQDYEWVRHNLPNVPEEMKKILKFELDKENSLRKETEAARTMEEKAKMAEAKAKISEMKSTQNPQTPQIPQTSQGGQGGYTDGRGGAPDGQGGMDPIQEITKLGYSAQDFANDPGFVPYWKNKTVAQLLVGLKARSDFDVATGRKKTAAPAGSDAPVNSDAPTGSVLPEGNALPSPTKPTGNSGSLPNYSLIKFNSDPNGAEAGDETTLWIVDNGTKSFRPLNSEQALRDLYSNDSDYQSAINGIIKMDPSELQTGRLKGYNDLGESYTVYEGRNYKALDYNPNDLTNAYGYSRTYDKDLDGAKKLNSFMVLLNDPTSGIDSAFLSKIKNDKVSMALYINGLAYGGYTPNDIYKDIKRQQLVEKGDASLKDVKVISSNTNRSQYVASSSGSRAAGLDTLTPPSKIGNVNQEIWDSPASQLSDEYFKLTNPESYDPNSQTFKDKLASINPELYDYIITALTSNKESDKAIADSKWMEYKSEIEKTTGRKLSDNALVAWRQLEKLDQSNAEAGLLNTGIANEQVDETLRDYREQNKRLREDTISKTNTEEANQARASYSPDQIQAMNNEDQAKGLPRDQWRTAQWGLTPSTPVTKAGFISQFRSEHPDKTTVTDDQIIERYYDNIYDQNGNRRSTLYQNYQDNVFKTKYGYNLDGIPAVSENQFNNDQVLQDQLDADKKLARDATSLESGEAFSDPGATPNYEASAVTAGKNYAATEEQARIDKVNADKAAADQTERDRISKINADKIAADRANINKTTVKKQATLYDSKGTAKVVDVGSSVASGLQSQGWTLNKPTPVVNTPIVAKTVKKATQWNPITGKKEVMNVGDPFKQGYQLYTGK